MEITVVPNWPFSRGFETNCELIIRFSNLYRFVSNSGGRVSAWGTLREPHRRVTTISLTKNSQVYPTDMTDSGYRGKLIEWVQQTCHWVVEIIKCNDDLLGCHVLPWRWFVERTFALLGPIPIIEAQLAFAFVQNIVTAT